MVFNDPGKDQLGDNGGNFAFKSTHRQTNYKKFYCKYLMLDKENFLLLKSSRFYSLSPW
jgi:hypothetical protein